MLRIIQSNDMEVLVQHLLRDAARHPPRGLEAEQFIVPSLGVGRWLKSRIAARRGIAANIETPYAAQWVWQQFAARVPGVGDRSPFDTGRMQLRLFAELQRLPADPMHAALQRWVERQTPAAVLAFAGELAQLFQRYLAFRPDWLEAWGRGRSCSLGPAESWQRRLWQKLLAAEPLSGPGHPAEDYFRALDAAVARGEGESLPTSIRLIGLPSLPPLYLDIFHRLSRYTAVTFWWLNPCRSYWVDLVPARLREPLDEHRPLELPETGHSLLSAWAQQSREQLARFLALEGLDGVAEAQAFIAPTASHQLARLQRSLLDAAPMAVGEANPGDTSITLHDCHSLTRQLEVLHDALLHRFAADDTLSPADVVVLVPALESAAATIDAVWGALPADRALPYAISGAAPTRAAPLTRALRSALVVLQGRFAVPEIVGLLQEPPVAARFGFQPSDFPLLHRWLTAAGAHWGSDAGQIAALGLPAEPRHTWAAALERLLLGSVMPLQGLALSGAVKPVEAVAGLATERLGQLLLALRSLEAARLFASVAHPLRDWCQWLGRWLDELLAPALDQLDEESGLRAAMAALAEDAARTASDEKLPLAVFAALFEQTLAQRAPGGVATGRITFTTLHALRGVPFRIVCVLGLDNGSLPRQPVASEFDLLHRSPRAGDRDVRNEDRGAFLDALLAARDAFWLAYSGRSARDNATLPPAVVVSELVDALGAATVGGRAAWLAAHRHAHALQGFSPRYFEGPGPRSFAADLLPAAATLAGAVAPRLSHRPLLQGQLPRAGIEWRRVPLARFLRFWRHPVRALLQERLGISLPMADDALASEEPFALPKPWALDDEVLALYAAGLPAAARKAVLAADVRLPPGLPGQAIAEQRLAALAPLAARYQELRAGAPAQSLPFALTFETSTGPMILEGTLTGVLPQGLLAVASGPRQWFQVLPLRLQHLVLNALAPVGVTCESRLLSAEGLSTWPAEPDAHEALLRLLEGYWQGLHAPHPFRPKAGMAWREAAPESALETALKVWRGSHEKAGENDDPWYRLLEGRVNPALPEGFEAAAEQVFGWALPVPQP